VAPHQPADPAFESRVRDSFARQGLMRTMGATLARVGPGEVAIALTVRRDLTEERGLLHPGAMAAIAGCACSCAALSLATPGAEVVPVEFKANLLAPARGVAVVAQARVLRPGPPLTVCACDVLAIDGREQALVLTMLATVMTGRGE
jgi:uncharacterized protein (TIGR00369 family)